ncbi:MAG: flagellar motor switch protein FliN, partial [Desulfosarcina sp.]
ITNGRDFVVRPTRAIKPARFLFSRNDSVIIVDAGIRRDDAAAGESVDDAPQVNQAQETLPLSTPAPVGNDVEPFKNVGLVMNIPLQVTVELGRTRRRINDVLKMGPGSVLEMEQMEGEPVDILINQTLIAKGVVVVEKEKYGIRISEIVSRGERMKSIR